MNISLKKKEIELTADLPATTEAKRKRNLIFQIGKRK